MSRPDAALVGAPVLRSEDRALLVGTDAAQAEPLVKSDLALEVENFELDRAQRPVAISHQQGCESSPTVPATRISTIDTAERL